MALTFHPDAFLLRNSILNSLYVLFFFHVGHALGRKMVNFSKKLTTDQIPGWEEYGHLPHMFCFFHFFKSYLSQLDLTLQFTKTDMLLSGRCSSVCALWSSYFMILSVNCLTIMSLF